MILSLGTRPQGSPAPGLPAKAASWLIAAVLTVMVPSVAADCLPLRGSSVCGSGFGDYSVDPAAFATLNEQFPVLGLTASSSIADMDKALAALAGASGNSVSPFFTRLGCPTQRDIPGRYMESATCALLISYSGSCPSNPTGRGLAAIAGKNNVVTTANQKVPSVCTTIVEKFNTSVTNYMSASCPSADMDFWKTYITSLTRTIFDDSSCVQGLSEERALCGFSNSPVGLRIQTQLLLPIPLQNVKKLLLSADEATPVRGLPSDTNPTWCSKCPDKPAEAEDIFNRKCPCPLKKQPYYALPTDMRPTWCAHSPDRPAKAEDTVHRKCPCAAKKRPMFG
ncbi:hypothetical protein CAUPRSCDRAFT_12199 [Caulochytrium protostelioides]|uniref:Uncharacterized protein n=1 Tax=Caulochytrium protostelioides TaxID=1555241 RepID=A0A4P9WS79_9FUNG|nr:hypothetical protein CAUPRSCDRAFT_12199 [Caulochytrium protostelioides]